MEEKASGCFGRNDKFAAMLTGGEPCVRRTAENYFSTTRELRADTSSGLLGFRSFGRKCHPPKSRAGLRKLQTNLRFAVTNLAEVYDVAFLLVLGRIVSQLHLGAADRTMLHGNQSAVSVYGESDRLFHKGLALRVATGNAHVYLH